MTALSERATEYHIRLGDSTCRRRQRIVAALLAASAQVCLAQDSAHSGPLYDELARMDSALFEAAFVTCDADNSCPQGVACDSNQDCLLGCGGADACLGDVVCTADATCDIDCNGVGACDDGNQVNCDADNRCDVDCGANATCLAQVQCQADAVANDCPVL